MLPAACYDLARYGPRRIVLGVEREPTDDGEDDEQEPTESADKGAPQSWKGSADRMVRLSRDELQMILTGRETAQRYLATFISVSLSRRLPSPGCAFTASAADGAPPLNPHPCIESFYFIHLNLLRAISGIACGRDADPLFTLLQAGEMLERKDFSDGERVRGLGVCEGCKTEFRECVKRAREEVWRLIPGWFGLGGERRVGGSAVSEVTAEMGSKDDGVQRELRREVESV